MSESTLDLMNEGPVVINVGVAQFGESIAQQDVEVVQVNWSPPPQRDEDLDRLLDDLL
jgi:hypothetical protein